MWDIWGNPGGVSLLLQRGTATDAVKGLALQVSFQAESQEEACVVFDAWLSLQNAPPAPTGAPTEAEVVAKLEACCILDTALEGMSDREIAHLLLTTLMANVSVLSPHYILLDNIAQRLHSAEDPAELGV